MTFSYTLPRKSGTYKFIRVDQTTRNEEGEITTVISGTGSIMRQQNTQLKELGNFQAVGPLELGDDLVRIYYLAEDSEGEEISIRIATMYASQSRSTYTSATNEAMVTLYSALLPLKQTVLTETLTLDAGDVAVDEAITLITEVGLPYTYSASTKQLNEARSWEPGTEYIDVVNDLMDFAGYWSVRPDRSGRASLQPYQSPLARTSIWSFAEGPDCIFESNMQFESDAYDVPNVFVVVSSNPTETFSGSFENDNADSPYSTTNRGREIATVRLTDDADDTDDCDDMAERDAQNHPGAADTYTVRHAYVPVTISDLVSLSWTTRDVQAVGTIQSQTLTLDPPLTTTSAVKRVWGTS